MSRGHFRDLKDGFAHVVRTRSLLTVLIVWTIALGAVAAAQTAQVFLAKDAFNAGDFGYGLIFGCVGLGLAIGSFGAGSWVEKHSVGKVYAGSILVQAIGVGAGRGFTERVGRAAVLRPRRHRQRRGSRLQLAARAARRTRCAPRPCLHGDHERELPRVRHRLRRRRPADRQRRAALGIRRRRRRAGDSPRSSPTRWRRPANALETSKQAEAA